MERIHHKLKESDAEVIFYQRGEVGVGTMGVTSALMFHHAFWHQIKSNTHSALFGLSYVDTDN
jgi:hypothetical protein